MPRSAPSPFNDPTSESGAPESKKEGVNSLRSSFKVLKELAHAQSPLSVRDLAERSELSLATTRRLARSLAGSGYVLLGVKDEVTLGPRLIHLGATASLQLGEWVSDHLERLTKQSDMSAALAVLDSDEVVYLATSHSSHSLGTFQGAGQRVRPHCTAVGKVLLSRLTDDFIRGTLQRTGMPSLTETTITDPNAFLEQIAMVRRQGFAVEDGEQDVGVRCLALPVLNSPRNMAISISAPESRFPISRIFEIVPTMEQIAREISESLADGL